MAEMTLFWAAWAKIYDLISYLSKICPFSSNAIFYCIKIHSHAYNDEKSKQQSLNVG